MSRYARQNDKSSCGPTAIINAMKWAGYYASYKKYKKIIKARSNCHGKNDPGGLGGGTKIEDLRYALCATPELAICEEVFKPTLQWIDKQLDQGRAVILTYYHKKGGHYTLITDKTEKYYVLVNDSWTKTVTKRHRKTVLNMVRRRSFGGYPSNAWSIEGL